MKKLIPFIFFLSAIFFYFVTSTVNGQEHQKLEYDVGVTARIVPVFAVDAKGNPVFDLNKQDILFYVNGKHVPFIFERYTFDLETEMNTERHTSRPDNADKPTPYTGNRRVIFIVIDAMFNSKTGLKRSKTIAANLIRNKLPGDDFIVLENQPGSGLKYIAGPDNNEKNLITSLNDVTSIPERFDKGLLVANNKQAGSIDASVRDNHLKFKQLRGSLQRYRLKIKQLSKSLSKLKYALKTISRPKIVYLISEGAKKLAFVEEYVTETNRDGESIKGSHIAGYLYQYLKDLARAINEGGSVLYTINPAKIEFENLREDNVLSDESMNYMARESGGKYFSGSDPFIIAKEVQKTTAAYYELAFTLNPNMGKIQKFKIKCTRPGVRIHSIKRMTSETPYPQMKPVEKKLFALNVANQGAWSRMVAKTRRASYKMTEPEKKGNKSMVSIQVSIPAHLKNKKVDIFMIRTGKGKDRIDFDLHRKTTGDIETITFEKKKNRKHYFVIIEPTAPYCIYNRVKW
jgi:hypothetical protein